MSDENVSKPNGLGVDPMQRLASFKPPRDYTLGASKAMKKVFTPNLNVARNKNKGSSSNSTRDQKNSEKGKKDRKNDRNKNHKNGPNIIKSGGVFSEGLGSAERNYNRSLYGSRDLDPSETSLKRPTIRVKDVVKIDKELEEQKIKMVMGRSSGDVEEEDFKDAIHNEAPVKLPMDNIGWSITKRKPTVQVKKEIVIKSEPDVDSSISALPKVDLKPVLKMNPFDDTDVVDLLRAENPALILIKMPDSLPGRGPSDDDNQPRHKTGTEPSTSSETNEGSKDDAKCTLKQLEEGRIGKLLVRRSGRVTLKLGDTQFEVTLGTKSAFHQELVSVSSNSTSRSARLVSIGHLQHKLTVVPDWENLFLDLPS